MKHIVLTFVPNSLLFKEIKGEIVVITGGGSGIGRQLAIKLSEIGCPVIIWDVNEESGLQTAKLIRDSGNEAHFYKCDVSKRNEVYATAKKVKDEVGSVSILINNAAIVTGQMLLDCPDYLIQKTIEVNALAHFWTCKAFLPDMISSNYGHVVTVASLAGYAGGCRMSDYCASKAAAISFHESLYMELVKYKCTDVKTTLICTSYVSTDLFRGADARRVPILKPEYVAENIISSIRSNRSEVIMPWYCSLLVVLKSLLPWPIVTKISEMFNALDAMDSFVGGHRKDEGSSK